MLFSKDEPNYNKNYGKIVDSICEKSSSDDKIPNNQFSLLVENGLLLLYLFGYSSFVKEYKEAVKEHVQTDMQNKQRKTAVVIDDCSFTTTKVKNSKAIHLHSQKEDKEKKDRDVDEIKRNNPLQKRIKYRKSPRFM